MKKLNLLIALLIIAFVASAQNKLDQDREAIKSLAGFYKVTSVSYTHLDVYKRQILYGKACCQE